MHSSELKKTLLHHLKRNRNLDKVSIKDVFVKFKFHFITKNCKRK